MKSKKLLSLIVLIATSFFAFAQSANNTAVASSNMQFKIPEGANLKEAIKIDVSSVKFVSDLAAQKYAAGISNNLLSFKSSSKTELKLVLQQFPNQKSQSVDDWNKMISTLFPKFLNSLNLFNK